MIIIMPYFPPIDEYAQYSRPRSWLVNVLRIMREDDVHLESLRMSDDTYRRIVNVPFALRCNCNPYDNPSFAGLPIVLTCSYSYSQIDFADTFTVPSMPYGPMTDSMPYCTVLVPSLPAAEGLTDPSSDSTG